VRVLPNKYNIHFLLLNPLVFCVLCLISIYLQVSVFHTSVQDVEVKETGGLRASLDGENVGAVGKIQVKNSFLL